MYDKRKEESYMSLLTGVWGYKCMTNEREKAIHHYSRGSEDTNVWQTKGRKLYIITHGVWGYKCMTNERKQGKSEGFDGCDWPDNLTQIGLQSLVFQPVSPWNLMDNLEKKINRAPLLYYMKLCASFQIHRWIQAGVTVQKRSIWIKVSQFCPERPWNLMDDLVKQQGTSSMLH